MNKKIGYIIGIIAILLAVCVVGVFVFRNLQTDSGNNPSGGINDTNSNKESSVSFKDIIKNGDKITERFNIILNGKDSIFTIEYTAMTVDDTSAYVFGKMGDYELFYDGEEATESDSTSDILNGFIDKVFSEDYLKTKFNVNNFKFIEGEDGKMYLLVFANKYNVVVGKTSELYIFDDELKLVEGDVNYNDCQNDNAFTIMTGAAVYEGNDDLSKNGYTDTFGVCVGQDYCHVNVKIEGNKINYLKVSNFNVLGDPDYGTMEEREYTIKNSKLTYTVKNTFSITKAVGQAC